MVIIPKEYSSIVRVSFPNYSLGSLKCTLREESPCTKTRPALGRRCCSSTKCSSDSDSGRSWRRKWWRTATGKWLSPRKWWLVFWLMGSVSGDVLEGLSRQPWLRPAWGAVLRVSSATRNCCSRNQSTSPSPRTRKSPVWIWACFTSVRDTRSPWIRLAVWGQFWSRTRVRSFCKIWMPDSLTLNERREGQLWCWGNCKANSDSKKIANWWSSNCKKYY